MTKVLYSLFFTLAFSVILKAQETVSDSTSTLIEVKDSTSVNKRLLKPGVNSKPEPPGGMKEFYAYVARKMKNHRPAQRGKMKISFTVEKDGSITGIKIIEGLDEKTNKKIIKIIASSGKWTPGFQFGKPVRATFIYPITIN